MKIIHITLFLFLSISISKAQLNLDSLRISILLDLNIARSNPLIYGITNNLESEGLDSLLPKPPLLLNQFLNSKAQGYSIKLGKTIDKGSNLIYHSTLKYNESICVDYIHNVIFQFIKDYKVINKGHRKHLLSINNNDTRIGIGIYKISRSDLKDQYLIVILTE